MTAKRSGPKAPAGLSAPGLKLWRSITSWEHDDVALVLRPDEVALLGMACAVADTIACLEADVAGEPRVIITNGIERVDPILRELRSQRQLLAGLLRQIDLPEQSSENEWDNLSASQRARKAARVRWSS